MAIKAIDDEILTNMANGIRYSKDSSRYESDLNKVKVSFNNFVAGILSDDGTLVLPYVTRIRSYGIYNIPALTNFEAPNVIQILDYGLSNNINLKEIKIEKVEFLGDFALEHCEKLKYISLPNLKRLYRSFYDCRNLETVYIGTRAILTSLLTIPDKTIFYVNSEDLEWYSTATNWSVLYADGKVKSIEEMPSYESEV